MRASTNCRRSRRAGDGRSRRLHIEALEDRRLLATLTVNSALDNTIGGNGLVTLREAIIAANSDGLTDLGQTGSGVDTIEFDPVVFGTPQTITLSLGELAITTAIAIHGTGAANLTIDAHQASRIFNVDDSNNLVHRVVEIAGLTLTGGKVTGLEQGGAICSREILTLRDSIVSGNMADDGGALHIFALSGTSLIQNSTVSGNMATNKGGGMRAVVYSGAALNVFGTTFSGNTANIDGGGVYGIANVGSSLTFENSVFSANSARYSGGGIFARTYLGATTTVRNCTLTGNSATGGISGAGGGIFSSTFGAVTIRDTTLSGNSTNFDGGAIFSDCLGTGVTSIQNCTLSANHAKRDGGAIWSANAGSAMVQNCTLTGNTADADFNGSGVGGAIRSYSGTLALRNSIVAGNTDNSGTAPNVTGSVTASYTLIGNNTGSALSEAPVGSPDANGSLVGGPIHGTINPLLGLLANNGGMTQTHALLSGSPAIDRGDPGFVAPPDFDQRGTPFARVKNGGIGGVRIDIGAYELQTPFVNLPGDYDHDNKVDSLDYTVWKQNFGSTLNLAADGNGNLIVDAADYTVWRNNLGAAAPAGAASVADTFAIAPGDGEIEALPGGSEVSSVSKLAQFGVRVDVVAPVHRVFASNDAVLLSATLEEHPESSLLLAELAWPAATVRIAVESAGDLAGRDAIDPEFDDLRWRGDLVTERQLECFDEAMELLFGELAEVVSL